VNIDTSSVPPHLRRTPSAIPGTVLRLVVNRASSTHIIAITRLRGAGTKPATPKAVNRWASKAWFAAVFIDRIGGRKISSIGAAFSVSDFSRRHLRRRWGTITAGGIITLKLDATVELGILSRQLTRGARGE
jgi:hypothetical protein